MGNWCGSSRLSETGQGVGFFVAARGEEPLEVRFREGKFEGEKERAWRVRVESGMRGGRKNELREG